MRCLLACLVPVRLHRLFRLIVAAGAVAALFLLAACAGRQQVDPSPQDSTAATALDVAATPAAATPTPHLALALDADDVGMAPFPVRAGTPFTITTSIHNLSGVPARDVPVVAYLAALQDDPGYQPFLSVQTVTVPASATVPVTVPVLWNLASGEHRLWIQANRVPDAWRGSLPVQPEADLADNTVLIDLWVEPFEAQASTLCAGRVDLEIEPTDVLPEPDAGRVLVTIHNLGNRAVYNVPVVVFSARASGAGYSPPIPPCGGTARVPVELEGDLSPGDALTIEINPVEWASDVKEDSYENNHLAISAGFAPGAAPTLPAQPADYDFWVDAGGIELAQPGVLVITVQNRGTRDADSVPVQVENEDGRKVVDRIPLVRGQGVGVGAIRISALGTRAGTLTVTINPADAKDAYPEANRQDNVVTFSPIP